MDAYDIERYQKIHVWVGSNFSPEEEYLKYFELDYTADLGDPDYKVCGFCRDIGTDWYDEDLAVSVTKCNTRGKVLHDYSLHPLDHRRARNANDHAYARRLAASHRPSSWTPTQHAESRGAAPVAAWAL
jgi:hypothetical protein